jgi:hypothetical protein
LLFPLALHIFGGGLATGVFVHFFVSFTLAGVVALTYSFFGIHFVVLRSLYPSLWLNPSHLRQTAREELRSVGPQIRLFELLAGLIPLAGAVLALGATPTASGRDLVTFLIIIGMTGFGLALHAARQINAAIALVTEGGDAKQ